jgi:hypothetical protein
MLRILFMPILMISLLAQASLAADSFESLACRSATSTYIQNTKELVIMSYELKGIVQSKSNAEILNNVSEQCVGILKRAGAEAVQRGFCRYMYPCATSLIIKPAIKYVHYAA